MGGDSQGPVFWQSHLVDLLSKHCSWSFLHGCRAHSMILFLEKWLPQPSKETPFHDSVVDGCFTVAFMGLWDPPLGFCLTSSPAPSHGSICPYQAFAFPSFCSGHLPQHLLKAGSFWLLPFSLNEPSAERPSLTTSLRQFHPTLFPIMVLCFILIIGHLVNLNPSHSLMHFPPCLLLW